VSRIAGAVVVAFSLWLLVGVVAGSL
jgi:hypothetical protein